jgi:chromosome segregation ATPase
MDSSKQFGIFIFSIFFIFCIVGCILLIIYTDDTLIKYASSSIICVLGLGLFKLTSNLLKCIKDQRKHIKGKVKYNKILGGKEIYEMDENEISKEIEKLNLQNEKIIENLNSVDNIEQFVTKESGKNIYDLNKINLYLGGKTLSKYNITDNTKEQKVDPIYNKKLLKYLQNGMNKAFSNYPNVLKAIGNKQDTAFPKEHFRIKEIKSWKKNEEHGNIINPLVFSTIQLLDDFLNRSLKDLQLNKASLQGIDAYRNKLLNIENYNATFSKGDTKYFLKFDVNTTKSTVDELISSSNFLANDMNNLNSNPNKNVNIINNNSYKLFLFYLENERQIKELTESLSCVECNKKVQTKIAKFKKQIADYQELKTLFAELQEKEKGYLESIDEFELYTTELQKQLKTIESDYDQLQTKYTAISTKHFNYTKEITSKEEYLAELENKYKNAMKEIETNKRLKDGEINTEKKRLQEAKTKEINELKTTIENFKTDRDKYYIERNELNNQIKEKKTEIDFIKASIESNEKKVKELQTIVTKLTKEIVELNEKLKKSMEENQNLKEKFEELESKNKELDNLNKKLQSLNEELQKNDKTELYTKLESKYKSNVVEIEQCKSDYVTLETNLSKLFEEKQKNKSESLDQKTKIEGIMKEFYRITISIKKKIDESENKLTELLSNEENNIDSINDLKLLIIELTDEFNSTQNSINKIKNVLSMKLETNDELLPNKYKLDFLNDNKKLHKLKISNNKELELLLEKIITLEKESTDLLNANVKLMEDIVESATTITKVTKEMEGLKSIIAQLKTEKDVLRVQIGELQTEKNNLSTQNFELSAKKKSLIQELASKQQEVDQLKEDMGKYIVKGDEITATRSKNEQLNSQIKQLQKELTTSKRVNEKLLQEKGTYNSAKTGLEDMNRFLEGKNRDLQKTLDGNLQSSSSLQAIIDDNVRKNIELTTEIERMKTELTTYKDNITRLEAENEGLISEKEELQGNLFSAQSSGDESSSAQMELERTVAELKGIIIKLESEKSSLKEENEKNNAELKRLNEIIESDKLEQVELNKIIEKNRLELVGFAGFLDDLETRNNESTGIFDSKGFTNKSFKERFVIIKDILDEIYDSLDTSKVKISSLESKLQTSKEEIEKLNNRLDKYQNVIDDEITENLKKNKSERIKISNAIDELESEDAALQGEVNKLKNKLKNKNIKITSINDELEIEDSELQTEFKELKLKFNEKKSKIDDLKRQLLDAKQKEDVLLQAVEDKIAKTKADMIQKDKEFKELIDNKLKQLLLLINENSNKLIDDINNEKPSTSDKFNKITNILIKEIEKLKEENNQFKPDLRKAREEIAQLNEKLKISERENKELKKQLEDIQTDIAAKDAIITKYTKLNKELTDNKQVLEENEKKILKEKEELEAKITSEKKQLSDELFILKSDKSSNEYNFENIIKLLENISNEYDNLQLDNFDNLPKINEVINVKIEDFNKIPETLQDKIKLYIDHYKRISSNINKNIDYIRSLKEENTKLTLQITRKDAEIKQITSENEILNKEKASFFQSLGSFASKIFSTFSNNDSSITESKLAELDSKSEIADKFTIIYNNYDEFINKKNKELEDLKSQISTLSSSNKEKDKLLKESDDTIIQMKVYQTNYAELILQLGIQKKEIGEKDTKISEITAENIKLREDIERINKENAENIEKINKKNEDNKLLDKSSNNTINNNNNNLIQSEKEKIEINNKKLNALRATIKNNNKKIDDLTKELEELREKTISKTEYKKMTKILNEHYKINIEGLIEENKQIKIQLESQKGIITNNEQKLNQIRMNTEEAMQKLNEQYIKLDTKIKSNEITIKDYETKQKELERLNMELLEENKQLKAEVDLFKKAIDKKDAEIVRLLSEKDSEITRLIAQKTVTNSINTASSNIITISKDNEIKQLRAEKSELEKDSAEINKQLKDEIKTIKQTLISDNLKNKRNIELLEERIKELERLNVELSLTNKTLTEEIEALQLENEKIKESYRHLEEKYIQQNNSNGMAGEDLSKIQKDKMDLFNKYNMNLSTLSIIKETLVEYKEKLRVEISKNKNSTIEKKQLSEKNIRLEQDIELLRVNNDTLSKSIQALNIELDRIILELANKNTEIIKDKATNVSLTTVLESQIQELTKAKDKIERSLKEEIEILKKDKEGLLQQIANFNIQSHEKKYNDLLIIYDKRIEESKEMLTSLQTCKTDLTACETKLKECNANNNNKELINENQRLKEEISILKSKPTTSNNEFLGDEIIILDSSLLLSKNTKQNEKSKIIINNDAYSKFIKKNKRM